MAEMHLYLIMNAGDQASIIFNFLYDLLKSLQNYNMLPSIKILDSLNNVVLPNQN